MELERSLSVGDGRANDPASRASPDAASLGLDDAWRLVLAVRRYIDGNPDAGTASSLSFAPTMEGWALAEAGILDVCLGPDGAAVRHVWWPMDPQVRQLLDLHLPHAARRPAQGYVLAILGQTLDGFIATREGQSRYINGDDSLFYLHRARALSDAVVIGVSTAVADCPQLTTRHVPGPDAVRVVIDPKGRLPADSGLLHDGAATTLVIRATDGEPCETPLSAQATALHVRATDGAIAPADVVAALAERGLTRLLVEGGGVTVSRFLEAGVLHRLQLAVSPVILGAGRPALPVSPATCLDRALRPSGRRYVMGEDVLFDLCVEEPPRATA